MKISKEEALKKIEELKKYVADEEKKETSLKIKLQIKTLAGEVLFESEKTTIKEAVEEAVSEGAYLGDADLRGADLGDANLRGANLGDANLGDANLGDADLRGADFYRAKFYGRGGTTKIKKNQVDDFFEALGVVVED